MGAENALKHPYFAPLPRKLFELPDGKYAAINYPHLFVQILYNFVF